VSGGSSNWKVERFGGFEAKDRVASKGWLAGYPSLMGNMSGFCLRQSLAEYGYTMVFLYIVES